MKHLILAAVALAGVATSSDKQAYTGVITDSECAKAGHAQMRMGPTDAECVTACVDVHGASYVLYDGKNVYNLSDQKSPEKFAAKKVRIIGTLNGKTNMIQVESIKSAE